MILRHKCWCSKIWVSAQNHNWKAVSVFIFFTFCRFPGESWSSCLRSLRVGAWPGWTTNRRFKCSRKLKKKHLKETFPSTSTWIMWSQEGCLLFVCLFTCLFCPPGYEHGPLFVCLHVYFVPQDTSTMFISTPRSRARGRRDPNVVGQDWRETEDSRGSCKVIIAIINRLNSNKKILL